MRDVSRQHYDTDFRALALLDGGMRIGQGAMIRQASILVLVAARVSALAVMAAQTANFPRRRDSRSPAQGRGVPQGKRSQLRSEGVRCRPGARPQERRGLRQPGRRSRFFSAIIRRPRSICARLLCIDPVISENRRLFWEFAKRDWAIPSARALLEKSFPKLQRQGDAPAGRDGVGGSLRSARRSRARRRRNAIAGRSRSR